MVSSAPCSHRSRFALAWKLSAAAVAAAAVVAMAACQSLGPGASVTAEATPTTEPTSTVAPTAIPTPEVAAWTGLDWTVATTAKGSCWDINDMVPWGDGYVGVGSSRGDAGGCTPHSSTSPAFFTSPDGLHWSIAQEGDPIDEDIASQDQEWFPARIVRVGDALLAIGHNPFGPNAPKLWRTEDGSTWTLLDNSSWREAFTNNTLLSVAAGPTGVVVVAYEGSGDGPQGSGLIIHSSDGLTWDRLDLSAVFDKAYLWDVTAYAGGFAIVGRVGEAEVRGGVPAPIGRPAAWTSPDGVTWRAAEVEGSEAPGATLLTVVAGADGLFATGYPREWTSWQSPRSGWTSTDGRSWKLLGEMGTDLPLAIDLPLAVEYPTSVVGDGEHMVMFGRDSCKTTELSGWTSLDGVTWTQLAFSGEASSLPTISGPICNDDGTEGSTPGSLSLVNAVVLPHGMFVMTTSSAPVAPSYWFLTATTH